MPLSMGPFSGVRKGNSETPKTAVTP